MEFLLDAAGETRAPLSSALISVLPGSQSGGAKKLPNLKNRWNIVEKKHVEPGLVGQRENDG